MGRLAEFLFQVGYYPIQYQSVKSGFLQWYYEAAQDELVIEGLQADNSQLSELALEAAREAENYDSRNPALDILELADERFRQIKLTLSYLTILLVALGFGTLALSVYTIDAKILSNIGILVSAVVGVPPVTFAALYKVFSHQIRENSELLAKFNRELVERPGSIRRNDRNWRGLAAQYLWNRSLGRPQTIHVLLLLAIIKVIRPKLYGVISGELQDQIREFIGKDANEIIRHEIERALSGEFGPHAPPSEPPPEPLSKPIDEDEYKG